MKTLKQACKPREEIFEPDGLDLREDIESILRGTTGKEFFDRTHITGSLERIITGVMARLAGQGGMGVIKLKQAMGGGKTHSQLAVGLLAQNPAWLKEVLPGCKVRPSGPAKVVVIDGRQEYSRGVWAEIARQMDRPEHFKDANLLQAPGEAQWRSLLSGTRTLILIDELPPYLSRTRGTPVGQSSLASQTVSALTNLLVSLGREGTEQCAVVISDLATEYEEESVEINKLLTRFTKEIDRGCEEIAPVDLGSEEVYQILRKRIFAELPEPEVVKEVSKEYRRVLADGAAAKLCTEDTDIQSGKILHTYPFSPVFKDLLARFRNNPRFRQTRGMLKLLANVTATAWNNGRADQDYLIGPEHIDMENLSISQEIETINSSLKNAIVKDVSSRASDATIQLEERRNAAVPWIGDAGRILLFSSLSANDLEQGLNKSELGTAVAAPGRDLHDLDAVVDTLMDTCQYLHRGAGGRIRFRNVENIRVWVKNAASGYSESRKEEFIRKRLVKLFEPSARLLYRQVRVFPALDEVSLEADRLDLMIKQPRKPSESRKEMEEFFRAQRYKNRVLFLTGSKNGWDRIKEEAGILEAIEEGLKRSDLPSDGAERKDLAEMRIKHEKDFTERLIQGFGEILYPVGSELHQTSIRLVLEPGHKDTGETQIVSALKSVGKYEPVTSLASIDYIETAADMLFGAKSTPWKEIKEKAAENGNWPWSEQDALEQLRKHAESTGKWRKDGENRVEKGPFEVEPTSVYATPNLNETELELVSSPPDAVIHFALGPVCTPKDKIVTDRDHFVPPGKQVTFIAVDPKGEHATGPAHTWEGKPSLKQDVAENGTVTLQVDDPEAEILYTMDGSDPSASPTAIPYKGTFHPPEGVDMVRAAAKRGTKVSKILQFGVGSKTDAYSHLQRAQPVSWTPDKPWEKRGATSINEFLALLKESGGMSATTTLRVKGDDHHTGDMSVRNRQHPSRIQETYDFLIGLLGMPERCEERSFKAVALTFPSLESLQEFATKMRIKANPRDVKNLD